MACFATVWTAVARSALAAPLFGMPTTYQIDSSPLRVMAGDIDAKNGLDLVTGNDTGENGPSLSILLNRGQGTFQPEVRQKLDASRDLLQAITVGDFNGDHAADIALAIDDLSIFPPQTVVLVFRNNGSGQLLGPDEYPLHGFFPECLEAADVNNDGVADLVVCHSTPDSGEGVVTVLLGRGNGSFASGIDFKVGTTPSTVAIGDTNSDGLADVVVGDTDARRVFVLYGTGDASLLSAPVGLVDVAAPSALAIRTSPSEALPELLVASLASNQVLILRQTTPRTFAPPVALDAGQPSSAMQVVDFDGDDIADLALLSPVGGRLAIWLGTLDGGFSFEETVSVDDAANSLAVADLNHDGRPDVATTSFVTNRVTVALSSGAHPTPSATSHGTGTPSPTRTPTPTPTRSSAPASATRTPTRTPTPSPRNTPTATLTPSGPGDANCDGHIDAEDITGLITRIFAPGCGGADVDGDGSVTVSDLVQLVQLVSESAR